MTAIAHSRWASLMHALVPDHTAASGGQGSADGPRVTSTVEPGASEHSARCYVSAWARFQSHPAQGKSSLVQIALEVLLVAQKVRYRTICGSLTASSASRVGTHCCCFLWRNSRWDTNGLHLEAKLYEKHKLYLYR